MVIQNWWPLHYVGVVRDDLADAAPENPRGSDYLRGNQQSLDLHFYLACAGLP
jgi:hypothetical protein